MTDRLDLPDRYRRQVEALLAEHVPEAEVWAYGSRVNGQSHDTSDLDLVLRGPNLERIPTDQLADLEDAFEQSNIPVLIQTHDWARLPTSFHKEIERQHMVLQAPPITTSKPPSLTTATLGDIAEIVMGQSPPGSTVSAKGETPLLNGPTDFGDSHPSPTQFTSDGRKFAKPGDILFCVRGSTTGRMNWADQTYAIGRGIAAIRHRSEPSLQHYMRAIIEFNRPELLSHATGSTFPNVSAQQLAAIRCPNINVQEQRAIARTLSMLDDKIELNRRMSKTLENAAHTLFKSWFIDFDPVRAKQEGRDPQLPAHLADLFPNRLLNSRLGSIPTGWIIGTFNKIAYYIRDTEYPANSPNTPFSHYSIPAYDSGRIPIEQHGILIKSHKAIVSPGSILVSRLNPDIERVWLTDVSEGDRAICSTEFMVLIPRLPFTSSYLYCLARSRGFRRNLESLVTGTSKSHQRAPAKAVMSMGILVPPTNVATVFDKYTSNVLSRALLHRAEISLLGLTRDLLLQRFMSGTTSLPQQRSAPVPRD